MKNINSVSQVTSALIKTSAFNQIVEKLSGENITAIVVSAIAAGTLCYVCKNGGNLEIMYGEKKIVLNRFGNAM